MNLNHILSTTKRAIFAVVFIIFFVATKTDAAESEITFQSPDKKFGIRNFEDGRVELVALPSRKRVLKLDLYGEIEVTWSPDSRRFTACEGAFEDDVQLYPPKIYQLEGATFRLVKLPELILPAVEWPGKKGRKEAHGREFILPTRWLDANTLMLKRECLCNIFSPTGEETDEKEWSLKHQITLTFDAKNRVSIHKVARIE